MNAGNRHSVKLKPGWVLFVETGGHDIRAEELPDGRVWFSVGKGLDGAVLFRSAARHFAATLLELIDQSPAAAPPAAADGGEDDS